MSIPVLIFARVSKESQDFGRQLVDLQRHADQHGYQVVATIAEKLSGSRNSRAKRPDLDELMTLASAGTVKKVLVTELSRLGRRARETRQVIEELQDLGVSVYAQNIGMETLLDTGKPNSMMRIVMAVLMEVDEMESERISVRSKSGQQHAWSQGKQKGRPTGTAKAAEQLLKDYPKVVKYLQSGNSVRETAKLCGCSKNTVQKVRDVLPEFAQAH
jgi:DNA invertase Pin-like site-specific DNA recombinase